MGTQAANRETSRRYATPTGEPCPYLRRADGTVEGDGACRGCGTCLLGAGWEGEEPLVTLSSATGRGCR